MMLAAVFITAWLGFALLALSQSKHWRRVTGTETPPSLARVSAYRAIAATLLTISLALALLSDGPSFGFLLWATTISIAALAVAFTLAWRPKLLRWFALGACRV